MQGAHPCAHTSCRHGEFGAWELGGHSKDSSAASGTACRAGHSQHSCSVPSQGHVGNRSLSSCLNTSHRDFCLLGLFLWEHSLVEIPSGT